MSTFYLLFDRVEIEQANAIPSPLTYGFPAIGGFVGAIHHLARRLAADDPLALGGVLIACHRCAPRIFRARHYDDATFIQGRNPLLKSGETAAIVEEGKVNLTVSLVVEATGDGNSVRERKEMLCQRFKEMLMQQRVAGGSVRAIADVRLYEHHHADELAFALAPAFVLTDAREEMAVLLAELRSGVRHCYRRGKVRPIEPETATGLPPRPQATALDVLLATAELFHLPPCEDETAWGEYSVKKGRGWLVPIAVGYQGIAPRYAPGEVRHLRTPDYPSHYVEAVHSLGRWVFAPTLAGGGEVTLEEHFWRYQPPRNNLYLFTTSPHH